MIKVIDIDYDLSLKLGDPRDDLGDGKIFTRQDRLKYLTRAYGRLHRILEKATREYQPLFVRMRKHTVIELVDDQKRGWRIEFKDTVRKIDELYVECTNNKIYQCAYVDEQNYITATLGLNELYYPNYDKGKIFYSYFRNAVQLIPQKDNGYSKLHIVYQIDIPELNIDSTIEISNDYRDLLIVMAAKEGMEDIARSDKVQLYRADINEQLQLLGLAASLEERNEGAKASG